MPCPSMDTMTEPMTDSTDEHFNPSNLASARHFDFIE